MTAPFAHLTGCHVLTTALLCILSLHARTATGGAPSCPPRGTKRCDVHQSIPKALTATLSDNVDINDRTLRWVPHAFTWSGQQQILELQFSISNKRFEDDVGFSVRLRVGGLEQENKFYFNMSAAERNYACTSRASFSIFLVAAVQMPAKDLCASLSKVSRYDRTVVLNASALHTFYEENRAYQAGKTVAMTLLGAESDLKGFDSDDPSFLRVLAEHDIPANNQCKPVRLQQEKSDTADGPAGVAQLPHRSDGVNIETVSNVTTIKALGERINAPVVVLNIQVSRERLGNVKRILVVLKRNGKIDDQWHLVPRPRVVGNASDGGESFTILLTTDVNALESSCYKLMPDGLSNSTGHHLIAESKALAEVYKSGDHFHGGHAVTAWVLGVADGPGESGTAVWRSNSELYIPGCEDFGWSRSVHWTIPGSSGRQPMCTKCVPPKSAVKNFRWCLEGQSSLHLSWVNTVEPVLVDRYRITVSVMDVHGRTRTVNWTSTVSKVWGDELNNGPKETIPDVVDSIDNVHSVDIVQFAAVCRNPETDVNTSLALDLSEQLSSHRSPYCDRRRSNRTLAPLLAPAADTSSSVGTPVLVTVLMAVLLLLVVATTSTFLCVRKGHKRRQAADGGRSSKGWSCFTRRSGDWVSDKEISRQDSQTSSSSPELQYASPTQTLSECARGAGLACREAPAPTVYLAYDRRDLAKVSELHHALEWFGVDSILDKHYHRDSPAEWLEEQLEKADFILAVISHDFPHSTTSMKGKLLERSDADLDREFEEAESKKLLSLWFHRTVESPTPLCAYLKPYDAAPHSTLSGVRQAHKYNVDSQRLRHDFAGPRFCPEMRSLLYRLYSVDEGAMEIVFPPSMSGKSTPSFVLPCASPSVA